MLLKNFLLVGLGGFLGSILRYAISLLIRTNSFPLATFLVNVSGSFLLGLILGYAIKNTDFDSNYRIFLATGFCGGFTTFSTFTIENIALARSGSYGYLLLYVGGSLVIGIFAAWFGLLLMK